MKKFVKLIHIKQNKQYHIIEQLENLALKLNIQFNSEYIDMYFGFPFNTCKYRIRLLGEEKDIIQFRKLAQNLY